MIAVKPSVRPSPKRGLRTLLVAIGLLVLLMVSLSLPYAKFASQHAFGITTLSPTYYLWALNSVAFGVEFAEAILVVSVLRVAFRWRSLERRLTFRSRTRVSLFVGSILVAVTGAAGFAVLAFTHLLGYIGPGAIGLGVFRNLFGVFGNYLDYMNPMTFALLLALGSGALLSALTWGATLRNSFKLGLFALFSAAFVYEVALYEFDRIEMWQFVTNSTAWGVLGIPIISNWFLLSLLPLSALVLAFQFNALRRFGIPLLLAFALLLLPSAVGSYAVTGWHEGSVVTAVPVSVVSMANPQPHAGYNLTISYAGTNAYQVVDNLAQANSTIFCYDALILWQPHCFAAPYAGGVLPLAPAENGTGEGG